MELFEAVNKRRGSASPCRVIRCLACTAKHLLAAYSRASAQCFMPNTQHIQIRIVCSKLQQFMCQLLGAVLDWHGSTSDSLVTVPVTAVPSYNRNDIMPVGDNNPIVINVPCNAAGCACAVIIVA